LPKKLEKELVSITIPPKGRTCIESIKLLCQVGILSREEKEPLIEAIESSKRTMHVDRNVVMKTLKNYIKEGLTELTVLPDRERVDRPWRVGFGGIDTEFKGIRIRIEGESHYTAPLVMRSHQADIILGGWDEYYAALIEHIGKLRKYVRKWPDFNKSVKAWTTDTRICGSANLKDFVGHFLVFPKELEGEIKQLKLFSRKIPIVINPVYEGVYANVLGNYEDDSILFRSVNDVEDAVKTENCIGIAIVQSGKTIREKDLYVSDSPIIESETIVAVNKESYENDGKVKEVIEKLNPLRYADHQRNLSYGLWYSTLKQNLSVRWLNQPTLEEMLLGPDSTYFPDRFLF